MNGVSWIAVLTKVFMLPEPSDYVMYIKKNSWFGLAFFLLAIISFSVTTVGLDYVPHSSTVSTLSIEL